jgi:hypothetical protein
VGMKRRQFLQRAFLLGAGAALGTKAAAQGGAPRVSFTFDDFSIVDAPMLSGAARNRAILDALQAQGLRAAAFVIGRNV